MNFEKFYKLFSRLSIVINVCFISTILYFFFSNSKLPLFVYIAIIVFNLFMLLLEAGMLKKEKNE